MENNTFSTIQELLQQKADYQARLNLLPYDGTPEIKEKNDGRYLYIRKRVASRLTSEYVGIYTDNYLIFVDIHIDVLKRKVISKGIGIAALIMSLIGDELSDVLAASVELCQLFGDSGEIIHYGLLILNIKTDRLDVVPELIWKLESLFCFIILDIAQFFTSSL